MPCRHCSRARSNGVPVRHPSADPLRLRLLLSLGVVLLAGPGCSRASAPAPPAGSAAARLSSEMPSAGPVAPPQPAGAPGSTRGEIAGVRYLEHMTGGARPDERVPIIVALHP